MKIKSDIKIIEVFDKPSIKGQPTKESLVITTAISNTSLKNPAKGSIVIGFSVKVPGDQPIPRIGKAIAINNMYKSLFDIDTHELPSCYTKVLEFFEFSKKPISPKLKKHIKTLLGYDLPTINHSVKSYTHYDTIIEKMENL